MSFEEFTQKVLDKFDISLNVMRMHYTLKFNPKVIQYLEDEDDLDNMVSHSDDFANVYIVESPVWKPLRQIYRISFGIWRFTSMFPSFNTSCVAIPYTIMLSRAQDECSSKVRVSSKRGLVVVEDVFITTPNYLPRQICKDYERDHGVELTYNQA
ncbi:hypothetical protein AAG906_018053 [Vitis piasezkii]